MTALGLITAVSQAVLLLIALRTLWALVRRPTATRLDITLMFWSLAAVVGVQVFTRFTGMRPAWLDTAAFLALLAQPYLLLRLVGHFTLVPRYVAWPARLGMGVSWLAVLVSSAAGDDLPSIELPLALAYFAGVEGYATVAFARGANRLGGVSARRMALAAAGSGLLAAAVALALVSILWPAAAEVVRFMTPLLAVGLGVCYYLGFFPPGWLRKGWQMEEFSRFLQEVAAIPSSGSGPQHALDLLCRHATRITGGAGTAAARWEEERATLVIVASDRDAVMEPGSTIPVSGRVAGRAWQEQQPIALSALGRLGSQGQGRAAALGARAILAVPISSQSRPWGVLVVYLLAEPLFADEDLELLQLLARQCAAVMEREELIDQQRGLLERLEANNRELLEASTTKSRFLASMSHELRTPLSAVIGFSELLLDEQEWKVSEEARSQYLQHIRDSGQHLLSLINDVLDLAKVEAGRMELQLSPVPLPDALANAVETVRPLAIERGLALAWHADGVDTVRADPGRLKQVLLNLLGNAIKFTDAGGRIEVEARVEGNEAWVSVWDTGVGISPEDQERIFEEFTQVEPAEGQKPPGTGLGLALSRRLVELQGGRIWLESEAGRGSTFTFTLPIDEAAEVIAAPPPAVTNGQGILADQVRAEDRNDRPTVLIVEDDEPAARLLEVYLHEAGYAIEVAREGGEAVEKARRLRPVAIVLDLLLPGMDGWDLLRVLKVDPELREIPAVIVSVVDQRDIGLALGALDYFVKPVDREGLVRRVDQIALARRDRRLCVLAVDDEPAALDLIAGILEPEGHRVLRAEDGITALALARAEQPDLVLLDLLMPEMDGFEFLERLKADAAVADMPVLVLSAKEITPEDESRLKKRTLSILQKNTAYRQDLLKWLDRIKGPGAA